MEIEDQTITAVLFSGGKGSRLFPINEFYQKVMMPVGRFGTPMLEYVIRHLKHHGVKKFVALIGYKGNQIKRYFGNGSRFGVDISYVVDAPDLKGTGGALLNAKDYITTDHMLIYYTDILTSFNFQSFINDHISNNQKATVWLDPAWNESDHAIEYENGLATKMNSEITNGSIYVNTGISALHKSIFANLKDLHAKSQNDCVEIDLSRDLFAQLAANREMRAYVSPEWWLDIGSVARLSSLKQSLLTRRLGYLAEEGLF